MFIGSNENHKKVAEKINVIRARFGRVRPRELGGLSKRANHPTIDFERLVASDHAKTRMAQMKAQGGLEFSEVVACLRLPERVRWSAPSGAWVWIGGRVAIPMVEAANGSFVIKTVMWSDNDLFELFPRPTAALDERNGNA